MYPSATDARHLMLGMQADRYIPAENSPYRKPHTKETMKMQDVDVVQVFIQREPRKSFKYSKFSTDKHGMSMMLCILTG